MSDHMVEAMAWNMEEPVMAYRVPFILDLYRVSAAFHRLAQPKRTLPGRAFRLSWPRRRRALLVWLLSQRPSAAPVPV